MNRPRGRRGFGHRARPAWFVWATLCYSPGAAAAAARCSWRSMMACQSAPHVGHAAGEGAAQTREQGPNAKIGVALNFFDEHSKGGESGDDKAGGERCLLQTDEPADTGGHLVGRVGERLELAGQVEAFATRGESQSASCATRSRSARMGFGAALPGPGS